MNNFSLLIRTDGCEEIGLGHLYRTLAIADYAAESQGMQMQFVLGRRSVRTFRQLSGRKPYILRNEGGDEAEALEVAQLIGEKKMHGLMTDSYLLTEAFYETLRSRIPTVPVFAIDDTGEKAEFSVSGFINFNFGADIKAYPAYLRQYSAIGAGYFPLRKSFLGRRRRFDIKMKPVKKVFLTMGGSDPDNQTLRIAGMLKNITELEKIDIVLGPAYPFGCEMYRAVSDDRRFILHQMPDDIASIMRKSDLAITGGGTTCYELLYLRVPVAILILAGNQELTACSIAEQGCGHLLGRFGTVSDDDLLKEIRKLIGTPSLLLPMSVKGSQVVDGRGGKRLSDFIRQYLTAYHHDLYNTFSVCSEYEAAAAAPEEYAKVKWGSPEGMQNRFHLALEFIDWSSVHSWIDVGCGTGAFLSAVEDRIRIEKFLGLDLSPKQIAFACSRSYVTDQREFRRQDFMDDIKEGGFDLVTVIGVLQKCGVSLRKAVARFAELVKPGGQVFVTTKNLEWQRFKEPGFVPHPDHHWFRMEDIKAAFLLAGLKIIRVEGFEPRIKGKTCPPEDAHSIYVLAEKRGSFDH